MRRDSFSGSCFGAGRGAGLREAGGVYRLEGDGGLRTASAVALAPRVSIVRVASASLERPLAAGAALAAALAAADGLRFRDRKMSHRPTPR